MVKSAANNVDQYLGELPEDRRKTIAAMRELILENLPKGYVETIGWGMINYVIPLEQYPHTYNGHPLAYLGLGAQKNYNALYMLCEYGDEQKRAQLLDAFKAAGKKLDMGKSCLRFRSLDDLALDAIAKAIASTPPKRYIEIHEAGRAKRA
jgi:hypothetical protein